jgi:hemerythrin-like metal-binding protein
MDRTISFARARKFGGRSWPGSCSHIAHLDHPANTEILVELRMQAVDILGDHYTIGMPLIDAEHADLIIELNRLLSQTDNPPALTPKSELFAEAISRIGEKIIQHFEHEEEILKTCGFPASEVSEHIAAHERIVEQFAQLQFDMMLGKSPDHSTILLMIRSWVLTHLEGFDLRLRAFFSDDSAAQQIA